VRDGGERGRGGVVIWAGPKIRMQKEEDWPPAVGMVRHMLGAGWIMAEYIVKNSAGGCRLTELGLVWWFPNCPISVAVSLKDPCKNSGERGFNWRSLHLKIIDRLDFGSFGLGQLVIKLIVQLRAGVLLD
jgi:hypothetical protein